MLRKEDFEDFRDSIRSSKVKVKKSKELTTNERIVRYYLEEMEIQHIAIKLKVVIIHIYKVLEYHGLDY